MKEESIISLAEVQTPVSSPSEGSLGSYISQDIELKVKPDRHFAVDPDNFEKLVSKDVFVDKSLFIKDIIDDDSEHILITRPRRWGKTLNMDMLKTFFQPDLDEHGKFDFNKVNIKRKLFEGGLIDLSFGKSKELTPLKIAQVDNGEYLKKAGQIPVIFITFSNIVSQDGMGQEVSQELVLSSISNAISNAYKQHEYMLNVLDKTANNENIDFLAKKKASLLLEQFLEIYENKSVSNKNLQESIKILSQLLHEHYGRKVYIIIDEYDAPLNSSIGKDYYQFVVNTIKEVFRHGLKNNEHLDKVVMTGILRVAKADLFSGLNNFSEYGILDKRYAGYFGFTEEEVNQLLDENLEEGMLNEKALQASQIKAWYNGYKIGDYTIYNPWSIMHCLSRGKDDHKNAIQEYWIESGSTKMLEDAFLNLQEGSYIQLIEQGYFEHKIDKFVNLSDISSESAAFWSLLLHSGYLTKAEKINEYRIPNTEVKKYFYEKLLPIWFKKELDINSDEVSNLAKALGQSVAKVEEFKEAIETSLLIKLRSGEKSESYFQGVIGGLIEAYYLENPSMASHCTLFEKSINIEGRRGRIDNIFLPIGQSGYPIIHEYKKLDKTTNSNVQQIEQDALWQIYAKNYIAEPLAKLQHLHNKFQSIEIRAIIFFKDENIDKWSVKVERKTHTIDKAQSIFDFFSKLDKKIIDSILSDKDAIKQAARKELLKENKVLGLDQLIENLPEVEGTVTYITQNQKETLTKEKIKQQLIKIKELDKIDLDEVAEFILRYKLNDISQITKNTKNGFIEKLADNELKDHVKGLGKVKAKIVADKLFKILPKKRKIEKASQSEEDIDMELYQKSKRIKEADSDDDEEMSGVIDIKQGMVKREIENNLMLISFKNDIKVDFYIEKKVLNIHSISINLIDWWDSEKKYYGAIIKLEDHKGKKHVVLLHAIKLNDEAAEIKIIEPLSKVDSTFTQQITGIVDTIAIPGTIEVVYSARQDKNYATCGDMSLIMLRELLDKYPDNRKQAIKLLGSERVLQEAAPYLHSLLLEQKIIKDAIEEVKPPYSMSIVKTLPQKSGIIPIENKLLITNIESTFNQEKANYYTYSSSLSSVFTNLINKVLDKLDLSWQYKKVIYHQDITKFAQILKDNNIDKSVDVLKDHSELRKSVLIKLHPDKGGSNEDFAFVNGLEEKLSEQIDIDRLLREKIQQAQPYIYKAGLGFKALDAVVDVMRVLHEPTAMNAKKVAVDAAHLYGMHNGFNGFSMAISGFDSGYSFYQGNYSTAVQQLATTAFYMGLPKAMGYIGVPYLGFAYSAAMVAYSGYGALANLYSFYNEYNSEDSSLRSATAYKGILDFLEATPLKWLYDFSSNAKSYQVKINNLNLSNEKKILEKKLKEEKGEFGEKLYKYIYKPLIEEKYELQNKVLQGEITEEEADILKSKQISITTEDKIYDHCMEIKNLSRNENSKEHYYCYNEKQEVLDHIAISGNAFELLESF